MKKAILILLCCALLVATISCNKSDNIDTQHITENKIINSEAKNTSQSTETSKADATSLEKYIGTWYDDFIPPHDLEIISKDNGAIECRLGIYRLTTFYLIITVEDGEFSFVDKYNFISGKIVLKDNSVFLMVEESNIEEIQSGANWLFTIKEETNVK